MRRELFGIILSIVVIFSLLNIRSPLSSISQIHDETIPGEKSSSTPKFKTPKVKDVLTPKLYSIKKATEVIQPLWRCNEPSYTRDSMLIFVHIFKTAGSTIR